MSLSPDEFHMLHGDKVRESLMMLEGYDGAFELLAHCHLPAGDGEQGRLYAIVRSTSTNRAHILVRRPESELPHVGQWRAISAADFRLLQHQIDSMTDAARECAHGMLAARSLR